MCTLALAYPVAVIRYSDETPMALSSAACSGTSGEREVLAMKPQEQLYTPREVALWLCCSESTIRRLARQGLGPRYVRMGRLVRYSREALLEYIRRGGDIERIPEEA